MVVEQSHIFCFVESNDWEGEQWKFYIEMTISQRDKLNVLVQSYNDFFERRTYKILDRTFTPHEVSILVTNSTSGYMSFNNDGGTLTKELPETVDWEDDDIFCKGGLVDSYCEKLTIQDKGLINKFYVSKTDGSPVNPNAEYFVLRLDDEMTDKQHLEACRKAVLAYAEAIKDHIPKLSEDLIIKYGKDS